MKKNLFLCMLAVAGMLFATSCSQDELRDEISAGDYVTATFSISTPDAIDTRAGATNVGKGTTVNYVACAVYDATGTEMEDLRQYVGIQNKKAQYSIRLVKGQAYRIAFFAYCGEDNGDCDYYNLTDLKNIQVLAAKSNLEERDAFTNYEIVTAEESMKPIEREITLYRPFAQLNLGSVQADIDAAKKAGVEVANTQIKVSNVYTAFNAYENIVAGQTSTVTFDLNEIPADELLVDTDQDGRDESFKYLALNYLLVGDLTSGKSLTDVEFVWANADGSKTNNPTTIFTNVPVERNYRTNIIGYLLTNPAVFNITIDEEFQKPDYIVSIWDGESVKEPQTTATDVLIASPAEWVWLKQHGTNGKNIKLTADLDFGGNEVKGLGFTGEFDGQGHIMSNMELLCGGSYYSNGLFQGDASGNVTVKNVTLENVVAECANPDYGYVGVIFGDLQNNATLTLDNVHVKGADLCGVQGIGGLVGFVAGGSTVNITNCSVSDSYLHNYAIPGESGQVASFVGKVVGVLNINDDNSSATNNVIEGYYDIKRKAASIQEVAATDGNYGYGTINGLDKVQKANNIVTKFDLDAVTEVADDAALEAALTNSSVSMVKLGAGEYKALCYAGLPSNRSKESLTILGSEGTKIKFANLQLMASLYGRLTIHNCEIERMPDKSWGHLVFGSGDKADGVYTVSNCTFNGVGSQGIYINEDVSGATYNILNCTFNGDFGAEGAITIETNKDVDHIVNVKGCTFNNIPATSHKICMVPWDSVNKIFYYGWTLNTDLDSSDLYWKE